MSIIPSSFILACLVILQTPAADPDIKEATQSWKPAEPPMRGSVALPAPQPASDAPVSAVPKQPRQPRPATRSQPADRPTVSGHYDRPARSTSPRRDPGAPSASITRRTGVVRLEYLPSTDVVESVTRWLAAQPGGGKDVSVVPVEVSNSLLVSAGSDELDTIHQLIKVLDQPQRQFRVKALLAELVLPDAPKPGVGSTTEPVLEGDLGTIVANLSKRGALRVLARPELLATENQPALLQLGSRQPRITGATSAGRGQTTSISMEQVGTCLRVTGRVDKDRMVVLKIDVERSYLGSEEEGAVLSSAEEGPVVRAQAVNTLTLETTVAVKSGQTAVLGGMVYQTQVGWGELLLLLQVAVVE